MVSPGTRAQSEFRPASFAEQSHHTLRWSRWVGVVTALVYFFRGTVLPWYLHVPDAVLIGLTILTLSLGTGLAVIGGGRCRRPWVLVLLTFGVGISQAEQPTSAGLHWLGIVLLVFAVGPVIQNPMASQLRAAAWKLFTSGMTSLTGVFILWYVFRLPSLGGRVFFTSFMNQSMLLGPIVGMGIAIALARFLQKGSWKWALLAASGLIPLLASGSRLATMATGIAVCFLIYRRKPMLGFAASLLLGIAIVGFIAGHQEQASDSVEGGISRKGTENTRADLWKSRMDEFVSSPFFGIGVAMGTGSGSEKDSNGRIRVEPGSSYLALLAMTGVLGTVAFFSALGFLVYRFATLRKKPGLELGRDILTVVGIYMAVHGVGEGWILGFGSPLCFIFWLWLGSFGDAALQSDRRAAQPQFRTYRRVRPCIPVPVNG